MTIANPQDQRAALEAKREFVRLQQEEQKAIDDAETKLVEEYTRKRFLVVAALTPGARAHAGLQEFYDEWSFKWNDDGSPAPTIVLPSQDELARMDAQNIRAQSALAGARRRGGRLRG